MDGPTDSQKKQRKPKSELDSRVYMDGKIYLFKRSDYVKPTWFCRIQTPGQKGYTTVSTKTTNDVEAYAFAEKLFYKNLGLVTTGHDLRSKYVTDLLKDYIEHVNLAEPEGAGRKSKLSYLKRWQGFFGGTRIKDVDMAKLTELNEWTVRQSSKDTLSGNTINRFMKYLKQFFKWCEGKGYVEKMPSFPMAKSKSERRPHFDSGDYRKLIRAMREFVKTNNPATKRSRIMLVNHVLILANTGIRVGEARGLKWRDIRQTQTSDGEEAICIVVKGKTGTREVVARTSDVKGYFGRILELRKEELGTVPSSDSLIFCHPDGKEILSFKKSFESLIKFADVEYDTYGDRHTLYSLRHTYATYRLQEGVHQLVLAQNMGTSVGMLEKYYSHMTNVNMATELMKTGNYKSSSNKSVDWLLKP